MNQQSKLQKDFTHGPIGRQLLSFSMPFLLSNLMQALYGAVDMIVVGNYSYADAALREAALSGVTIGGNVTHLVAMMVSGLTVSGTVLVGQYFGARKQEDVKKTIGTLFSLLAIVGAALTVLMLAFSSTLLGWLNTTPEAMPHAQDYLNICLSGTLFIFGYNAVSAVQRGMGDSKRPFIFVTVACLLNIVLDLLFVKTFGMGASGAALATVISQGVSFLLAVMYLAKNKFVFDFKPKSFRIYNDKTRLMLKIGIPSSMQSIIGNVSFLLMTALVNTQGYQASAAVGVVGRLNSFAILPAVAMSSSISAFAAQNMGAGRHDRARKGFYVASGLALSMGVLVFALVNLFPREMLSIFVSTEETIALGTQYIRSFSFDYLLVPVLFCMNGLIMGAGYSMFTMFTGSVASILVRMPLAYVLLMYTSLGLTGVGLAAPAASASGLIIAGWFVFSNRWTRSKTGIRRESTD